MSHAYVGKYALASSILEKKMDSPYQYESMPIQLVDLWSNLLRVNVDHGYLE